MNPAAIPERIHRTDEALIISWDDTHVGRYPARELRLSCPCAACRDEMTGRPLLDPDRVPLDVRPVTVELVGSYAIRVTWSDGHGTGIYTYELLSQTCPCERCRAVAC